jgi:pimeloyl-ACP methyl ester carboxylesterase
VTQAVRSCCWPLTVILLLPGCAVLPLRESEPVLPPARPGGVVFSVDGAGDFQASTRALTRTIEEQGLPLLVQQVNWSHGYGRILSDHVDHSHARAEGRRLAEEVLVWRQQAPDLPIFLVGHSAGCGVILAAAESLPPETVERIVLLAPAVSAHHDLRPALRCARRGVEVFHSRSDWFYLGLGVGLVGTSDRQWDSAAGRVGFQPVICAPEDAVLYEKLRQHPWHRCVAWTGNKGGHYGGYQPGFLRAYVVPLLMPCP